MKEKERKEKQTEKVLHLLMPSSLSTSLHIEAQKSLSGKSAWHLHKVRLHCQSHVQDYAQSLEATISGLYYSSKDEVKCVYHLPLLTWPLSPSSQKSHTPT